MIISPAASAIAALSYSSLVSTKLQSALGQGEQITTKERIDNKEKNYEISNCFGISHGVYW